MPLLSPLVVFVIAIIAAIIALVGMVYWFIDQQYPYGDSRRKVFIQRIIVRTTTVTALAVFAIFAAGLKHMTS